MGMMDVLRAEAEFAKAKGENIYPKLMQRLQDEGVKEGMFICINIENGEYVTAESRLELTDRFQTRFGNVIGWTRKVAYQ